jgi:hypothetical protein
MIFADVFTDLLGPIGGYFVRSAVGTQSPRRNVMVFAANQ